MSALGMGGPGMPASIQIGGGPAGDSAPDGDPETHLHDALSALQDYMRDEDDHADKAIAAKCIAALQGLLGQRQKGAESALGITPAHKAMSRAY